MRTSKLTEYSAFKDACKRIDSNPKLQFVEIGEYVLTSKKKMIESARAFEGEIMLRRNIYSGRVN